MLFTVWLIPLRIATANQLPQHYTVFFGREFLRWMSFLSLPCICKDQGNPVLQQCEGSCLRTHTGFWIWLHGNRTQVSCTQPTEPSSHHKEIENVIQNNFGFLYYVHVKGLVIHTPTVTNCMDWSLPRPPQQCWVPLKKFKFEPNNQI